MFPDRVVSAVSPLNFDSDYALARLAGKWLNAVPEIAKEKPIPSDAFKAITGEDMIEAREPYGCYFSYTPAASHFFNGNCVMTTTDQSGGFWRRWSIVHFKNVKPTAERVQGLDDQIINEEMPQILDWALEGARDYLENGLKLSPAHDRELATWKCESNSVLSWLADESEISGIETGDVKPFDRIGVVEAFNRYCTWCSRARRKPFGRNHFKTYMGTAGYTDSVYKGTKSYHGLRESDNYRELGFNRF
ncbi:MAG: hypothetical protein O3A71_09920 [Proteobacteria bacterium]|nr:hypothetical protein [Pseudomonadota bacterium]